MAKVHFTVLLCFAWLIDLSSQLQLKQIASELRYVNILSDWQTTLIVKSLLMYGNGNF
jgi:hypothetical protein